MRNRIRIEYATKFIRGTALFGTWLVTGAIREWKTRRIDDVAMRVDYAGERHRCVSSSGGSYQIAAHHLGGFCVKQMHGTCIKQNRNLFTNTEPYISTKSRDDFSGVDLEAY